MYYVYTIGLSDHLKEPWDNCYIGVTNNLNNRWLGHLKSKYTVGKTIRLYNLNQEENMTVIFSGTDKECFNLENILRPSYYMGLNEAIGGRGGAVCTSYEEHGKKLSKIFKGRIITWGDKISQTKQKNLPIGKKNPNAKKWILLNTLGEKIIIEGSFFNYCKNNNISASVLIKYIGQKVPDPIKNGYGGFRPKKKEHAITRENTTGWMLISKG